jgi:hypothetical protein
MSPRWVEPEGTPEQIADACVAHLAAGGRVDSWRPGIGAWRQSELSRRDAFEAYARGGYRFALVYSDPPQPERVPAPEGVTVISWTEPTDDEPRSLPIVRGHNTALDVPEPWTLVLLGHTANGYRTPLYVCHPPIPSPPVPETERVPWWEAPGRRLPHGELIGPIHHAYPVAGHSGGMYVEYHLPERDTTGNPQRGEVDGTVEVLVDAPIKRPSPPEPETERGRSVPGGHPVWEDGSPILIGQEVRTDPGDYDPEASPMVGRVTRINVEDNGGDDGCIEVQGGPGCPATAWLPAEHLTRVKDTVR